LAVKQLLVFHISIALIQLEVEDNLIQISEIKAMLE
jgi:hypothetical protein